MAMEWICSSEEECCCLWVKMPGLNSQCLRKYNKQQKVLSESLCLFSQRQNGNCKITQNSQESCEDSRLMPVMFLVMSEKCPSNKKPSSSQSETRVLWKLQCEVKHSSLESQSIQDWSLGGSPSTGPVQVCTGWTSSPRSQLLLLLPLPGWPSRASSSSA